MSKITIFAFIAFCIVILLNLSSFFVIAGSEEGEESAARERIEQAEEKILGSENYEKFEILHQAVENPVLYGGLFIFLIIVIFLLVKYVIKKKNNRKK